MASKIARYKIEKIVDELVNDKYGEKINERFNVICERAYDLARECLNKDFIDAYEACTPEQQIMFRYVSSLTLNSWSIATGSGSCYAEKWFDCPIKDYNDIRKFIGNKYVNIPFSKNHQVVLPYKSDDGLMIDVIVKNEDFRHQLIEYLKVMYEATQLKNKLLCVLTVKPFYPNTLKNEFPEAYNIYKKHYPNDFVQKIVTSSVPTKTDSKIEKVNTLDEIRNFLNEQ